jgi:carbonic anhydrase
MSAIGGMMSDNVIHTLERRFANFHQNYFKENPDFYQKLTHEGQSPEVLVIACSDSRTDPALLFQAKPGELFVARTIANWVPPYERLTDPCSVRAVLAFAVIHLNVKHIVVLGHSHCAGVKTLTHDIDIAKPVLEWTKTIKHETNEEHSMVHNVLLQSCNNLKTYPWIKERTSTGQLACHAWCFCLESGDLEQYDATKKAFKSLVFS